MICRANQGTPTKLLAPFVKINQNGYVLEINNLDKTDKPTCEIRAIHSAHIGNRNFSSYPCCKIIGTQHLAGLLIQFLIKQMGYNQ